MIRTKRKSLDFKADEEEEDHLNKKRKVGHEDDESSDSKNSTATHYEKEEDDESFDDESSEESDDESDSAGPEQKRHKFDYAPNSEEYKCFQAVKEAISCLIERPNTVHSMIVDIVFF